MSMTDWRLVLVVLAVAGVLLAAACAVLYRRRPGSRVRVRQVLGSVLLFGLAGPPLGGLVLGVSAVFSGSDPEPFRMLAFFVLMAYFIAGIPALVGGACAGLLRPVLRGWARLVAVAACCGLASALFGWAISGPALRGAWLMLWLGALSGALVEGALMGWQRRRGRVARAAGPAAG